MYHWVGVIVFWCVAYAIASFGLCIMSFFVDINMIPKLEDRYYPGAKEYAEEVPSLAPLADAIGDAAGLAVGKSRICVTMCAFGGLVAVLGWIETLARIPMLEYYRWQERRATTFAKRAP